MSDKEQEPTPDQPVAAPPPKGGNLRFPIQLPSQGLPYGGAVPGGNIEIGPLTTREEMIIAGFRESGGADMTLLIDSILKTRAFFPEGFNYEDLLVTDRFFLIANVRAISFGEDYGFPWRCPCSNKVQNSRCNLPGDLKLFKLAEGFHEPFEVTLPNLGKIGLRLLRISDEKVIDTYRQQMLDRATDHDPLMGDPGYLFKMARRIATINGAEVNLEQKLQFVGDMLSVDSIAMQEGYEENESGLSLQIEVKCRNCGQEREITLPFSAEFFRPESPRGDGKAAVSAKHFE